MGLDELERALAPVRHRLRLRSVEPITDSEEAIRLAKALVDKTKYCGDLVVKIAGRTWRLTSYGSFRAPRARSKKGAYIEERSVPDDVLAYMLAALKVRADEMRLLIGQAVESNPTSSLEGAFEGDQDVQLLVGIVRRFEKKLERDILGRCTLPSSFNVYGSFNISTMGNIVKVSIQVKPINPRITIGDQYHPSKMSDVRDLVFIVRHISEICAEVRNVLTSVFNVTEEEVDIEESTTESES